MTYEQINRILIGIGIAEESRTDIQINGLNNIIMSQNYFVDPKNDYFTFDSVNSLIKIKKFTTNKSYYDYYFDMANIVGFEFLSPKSRY